MPDNSQRILDAVRRAIAEVNQQLPARSRMGTDESSPLFGGRGPLDSLGLVNLVVATEEELEKEFGVNLSLLQDSTEGGMKLFESVATLCRYVQTQIENV